MRPHFEKPGSRGKQALVLIFFIIGLIPFDEALGQWKDLSLTMVSGETVIGSISSVDSEGVVKGTGLPAGLRWQDIVSIQQKSKYDSGQAADPAKNSTSNLQGSTGDAPKGGPTNTAPSIQLANESRFRATRIAVESDTVRIESSIGVDELPLQVVSSIVWSPCALMDEQLKESNVSEDRVIVSTPDGDRVVKGLLESVSDSQLQIQYQNQSRKINLNKVRGLITADVGLQPVTGAIATLSFEDGSIVKGVVRSLKENHLELALFDSLSIKFAVSSIRSIQIQSDRLLYLSEIDPVNAEQRTQFTAKRDWQKDMSVEKNRLTLRDSKNNSVIEYAKGLGTQAFTQLDYANSNDFENFQATVGIDSETKGRGDCQMMVQGDGVVLWSGQVKGTDSGQDIKVSIKGAKVISLIVYPGEMFDLADHANWCNARFTR